MNKNRSYVSLIYVKVHTIFGYRSSKRGKCETGMLSINSSDSFYKLVFQNCVLKLVFWNVSNAVFLKKKFKGKHSAACKELFNRH